MVRTVLYRLAGGVLSFAWGRNVVLSRRVVVRVGVGCEGKGSFWNAITY